MADERLYFRADDGATYFIVASNPRQMLELLVGHGFMDEVVAEDVATIALLTEDEAAEVMVYTDDRAKERIPLTQTEIGSVFSTEY